MIKPKFRRWLDENQASRYIVCPHCSKSILLKIRTEAWEAQKHPFFRDRILGNAHLIELYKQNKLTKEDLAKIFETSPDYVVWLVEKAWRLQSVVEQETNENNKKKEETTVVSDETTKESGE
jgi:DNA-directed RNA polymerase subunit RPC12/RpoP